MSTKYRNPASVASDRVLQLSDQWKESLNAQKEDTSANTGSSPTSGKVKPGKGLNNYSHKSSSESAPESEQSSNESRTNSQVVNEQEKQKQVPSTYAAEEDDSLPSDQTGAPSKDAKKDA